MFLFIVESKRSGFFIRRFSDKSAVVKQLWKYSYKKKLCKLYTVERVLVAETIKDRKHFKILDYGQILPEPQKHLTA